ncbi:MAG: type II toxin-antitoxin system PemK/MazF family toxin [Candidatus Woesearchaeota archaeon]
MVKRGDIVLVDLDPGKGSEQKKTRPALIIQHDSLNKYGDTTIIIPITSTIYDKDYAMHVRIKGFGLKKEGTLKVEHIRSIDKKRIKKHVGKVNEDILDKVKTAFLKTCDYY